MQNAATLFAFVVLPLVMAYAAGFLTRAWISQRRRRRARERAHLLRHMAG